MIGRQDETAEGLDPNLKIATVSGVCGAKLFAVIDPAGDDDATALASNEGMQIGALVKLPTHRSVAFGIVTSLSIPAPTWPKPKPRSSAGPGPRRWPAGRR